MYQAKMALASFLKKFGCKESAKIVVMVPDDVYEAASRLTITGPLARPDSFLYLWMSIIRPVINRISDGMDKMIDDADSGKCMITRKGVFLDPGLEGRFNRAMSRIPHLVELSNRNDMEFMRNVDLGLLTRDLQ